MMIAKIERATKHSLAVDIERSSKRALTIEAFCERYSVGRTFTYSEIGSGALKSVSLGRKRLIHVDDAEIWFASFRHPPQPVTSTSEEASRAA